MRMSSLVWVHAGGVKLGSWAQLPWENYTTVRLNTTVPEPVRPGNGHWYSTSYDNVGYLFLWESPVYPMHPRVPRSMVAPLGRVVPGLGVAVGVPGIVLVHQYRDSVFGDGKVDYYRDNTYFYTYGFYDLTVSGNTNGMTPPLGAKITMDNAVSPAWVEFPVVEPSSVRLPHSAMREILFTVSMRMLGFSDERAGVLVEGPFKDAIYYPVGHERLGLTLTGGEGGGLVYGGHVEGSDGLERLVDALRYQVRIVISPPGGEYSYSPPGNVYTPIFGWAYKRGHFTVKGIEGNYHYFGVYAVAVNVLDSCMNHTVKLEYAG